MLNCVDDCTDIVSGGRKWFSELKDSIHKCFKRIRIRSHEKDEVLQKMLNRRIFLLKEIKNLKKKSIPMNIEELEMKLKVLDEEITNYSVNKKSKKISKHIWFSTLCCSRSSSRKAFPRYL
jgi:hypothetical protein